MKWQPASELTEDVLDESWNVALWDGDTLWLSECGVTEEGFSVAEDARGWYIEDHSYFPGIWWVKQFMIIDKPPEEKTDEAQRT